MAQAGILIRGGFCSCAEGIDNDIVFTDKQIVQESGADGPVVGKGGGFLAAPFRPDRITGGGIGRRAGLAEQRQVAKPLSGTGPVADPLHQQLGRIGRIAPGAAVRFFAVSVYRGCIPPRGHVIPRSPVGTCQMGFAVRGECLGLGPVGDQRGIQPVAGPAAEPRSPGVSQPAFRIADAFADAAGIGQHSRGIVAPLVGVGKPVMGHELDPEGR